MVKWLENARFYEIYPQSFYDTNGDGIGDLPGVIQKLDYVKSLGCNAIWLNPCFESPFDDAGYDISDYKKIAPRYGTNEDMKQLLDTAHKKGLKVLLDLVPGHTSYRHPWFLASSKPEKNAYTDRYVWCSDPNQTGYGFYESEGGRADKYHANFYMVQPSLNYGYGNPAAPWQFPADSDAAIETREAIKDVMRFWMDLGADGFRVDMAFSLVKDDEGHKATMKIWENIREMMDKEYPQNVLVSEWGIGREAINGGRGFHMDFILHFNSSMVLHLFDYEEDSFFRPEGKGNIKGFLDEYLPNYEATRGKGYLCFVTGNHDIPRYPADRTQRQKELRYAFTYAMPGVPFLYYGDEIGMTNNPEEDLGEVEGAMFRGGARTPMQWDHTANDGFSTASAEDLYMPVDTSEGAVTVADEEKDTASLLNFVRNAIRRRDENPALGNTGDFRVLYAEEGKYPFIFEREGGGQRLAVAVNPAARAETAKLPVAVSASPLFTVGDTPAVEGDWIRMPPESFAIYTIKE